MRLKKLKLKNLRSYESATVADLSQLNIFAGGNGCGKSTIIDAIALGLTGTCNGADTGRGLVELRRQGSKRRFEVQIELRDREGKFAQVGRSEGDGPRSKAQEHVEDTLGVTGAQARACIYSGELLSLSRADAQKLIMDLAPSQEVEVPAMVRSLLAKHLGPSPPDVGVEMLEQWHGQAYEKRREVKRELSAMGDPEPSTPPEGLAGKTLADLEDGKQRIEDGILHLSNERAKINSAISEANREASAPDREQALVAGWTKRLAELQGKDAPDTEAEKRGIAQEIAKVEAEAKALKAKREKVETQIRVEQAKLDQAAKAVSALEGKDGTHCEVCRTKLTPAKVAKVREHWQAVEDEATKEIDGAQEVLVEINAEDDTADRIAALSARVKQIKEVEDQYQEVAREMRDLETKIAEHEQAPAEAPEPVDAEALQAEVDKLSERIAKGQAKLEAVAGRIVTLKAEQSHADKKAALEVEHGELDDLVKALGPDGLRKEIATGGGVGDFVAGVSAHMADLGFAPVDFGPLLSLEGDPTVGGIPLRHLSKSQRSRFGICFQVAVAQATGLGVVCVDDYEQFEPSVNRELLELLAGCGQQVFVCQVMRDAEKFHRAALAANRDGSTTRLYRVTMAGGVSSTAMPREAEEAA